jgi:hypothetical protein
MEHWISSCSTLSLQTRDSLLHSSLYKHTYYMIGWLMYPGFWFCFLLPLCCWTLIISEIFASWIQSWSMPILVVHVSCHQPFIPWRPRLLGHNTQDYPRKKSWLHHWIKRQLCWRVTIRVIYPRYREPPITVQNSWIWLVFYSGIQLGNHTPHTRKQPYLKQAREMAH